MAVRKATWGSYDQFNKTDGESHVVPDFYHTEIAGHGSAAKIELESGPDNDDNIPYTLQADYSSSDISKIIADENARLKVLGGTSRDWPFTTPANYIYDSSKMNAPDGNARLKDLRPPNATFYADYESDVNGTTIFGNERAVFSFRKSVNCPGK